MFIFHKFVDAGLTNKKKIHIKTNGHELILKHY